MKIFIVLTFCVVFTAAFQNTEFQDFKNKFGKFYRSYLEEKFRQKTFLENLRLIKEHNALHEQGKSTFTLAINEFADLTSAKFSETFNGYRQHVSDKPENVYVSKLGVVPPASIDWRDYGYVTGVKNQGNCGSCWAFSAVGSLEGQHFKSAGQLVPLSEQNLVDCSKPQGNNGCGGGWMDYGFEYVISNGIATEASYPYDAKDGPCRFEGAVVGTTARNYSNIARGDENALKTACAENGPISVAIDASGSKFQHYSTGVYSNPACSKVNLNHGVLVVGYGTENDLDYWLVKNSWGLSWGDKGYIKMSRNKRNQCGIVTEASYPIV